MALTSQKPSVMSTVLKKKKPVIYGALASKAVDPLSQAKSDAVTQALKPQQKATLLPAQVPSVAPKSVLPKPAPVTKVAPTTQPTVKPVQAIAPADQPNVARPNQPPPLNINETAPSDVTSTKQGQPPQDLNTPDILQAVSTISPSTKQIFQNQYTEWTAKLQAEGKTPPLSFDDFVKSQVASMMSSRASMEGNQLPKPAGGGPPPDSTVPTGETDASVVTNPPPNPQTYNPQESWSSRLENSGLKIKQGGRMYDDPSGPAKIQSLIDYDNQFMSSFPPEGQAWVSSQMELEQKNFDQAIAQYPDQWDKIFRDHQTRVKDIQAKWESTGKTEVKLNDILAQAPPELKVKIEDLPSIQQNDLYRKAIEQYGDNPSPDQLAAKYAEMFPNGYDFSLEKPGFTPDKGTLEDYQKQFNYDPTKSDATINKTDTSGVNTSGQTQIGAQVTQSEIDALNKELGAQPLTEEEKNKILAGDFASIDADKQAAIKSAVSLGAASGWMKNLATLVDSTVGTAQKYDIEKAKMRGDLTRQNLAEVQARRSAAIAGLGGVAAREAGIAGTQANAGLGAAEIASRENLAEGELQLAKDTLYQNGQLTGLGMQIDENLKAYGMKLDKYQTDQGFDLALMEKDLKERIANQTGDMAAAELEAKNITASIQAGMEERRIDDSRAAEIANLEQKAASGDVEAKNRTTQLRAETELRKLDLDNDWSQFIGQVLYNIMSGRETLNQRNVEFLESVRQYEESKGGGGFGSILGSIAGTLGGSLLGPVGTTVGGWLGNQITGGGKKPKVQS